MNPTRKTPTSDEDTEDAPTERVKQESKVIDVESLARDYDKLEKGTPPPPAEKKAAPK
jgi:hypothetical protein